MAKWSWKVGTKEHTIHLFSLYRHIPAHPLGRSRAKRFSSVALWPVAFDPQCFWLFYIPICAQRLLPSKPDSDDMGSWE